LRAGRYPNAPARLTAGGAGCEQSQNQEKGQVSSPTFNRAVMFRERRVAIRPMIPFMGVSQNGSAPGGALRIQFALLCYEHPIAFSEQLGGTH
jgi:hypothetical protein